MTDNQLPTNRPAGRPVSGKKILMTRRGRVVDGNLRARALQQITGAIPEECIEWVNEDGTPE